MQQPGLRAHSYTVNLTCKRPICCTREETTAGLLCTEAGAMQQTMMYLSDVMASFSEAPAAAPLPEGCA